MEKLSRVKKYEELRNQIDTGVIETSDDKKEPLLFKKLDIQETPKREKEITIKKNEDTFVNEYMDDLIKDVKKYNKEKGLLQSDITEIDILNQLKNPTRLKREDYVKTIEEQPKVDEATLIQSRQEIAMQIQQFLDEENEGMNVSKVEASKPEVKEEPIQEEIEDDHQTLSLSEHDETLQRLNEQTMQMKIKIEKQEEDLADLTQDIDKTNRLLNIILVILILALFAVIGFTVYTILKNGGKL